VSAASWAALTPGQIEALTAPAPPPPAGCINHVLLDVTSTDVSSNPLGESSLTLIPPQGGTYVVDFGSATPWLRSLQSGQSVYADFVTDGDITDVGPGTTMLHDTDSPAYLQNTAVADAVAFGSIALLMGAWSAALLRYRYRRVRVERRLRWWVPCSLPAVFGTILVSNHVELDPCPLATGYFTVPALVLAAGLALAFGLSRIRPRRRRASEPQIPAEWNPQPPRW
jgi:hypothetical protein